MTNYRITTPVKDFTGEVAGVAFARGVGHTSNPAALNYFRSAGYGVEPVDEQKVEPEVVEQEPAEVQPPTKSASKASPKEGVK